MRALLAALPLLAVLSATCAPVFAQSTPPAIQAIPTACTVTYGEVQNMRSLGVKIRFPDCKDKCERDLIDASVTPEQFMRADSLDFVGERLLKIPDFVYAMKNLKFISLKNSQIREDELKRLAQTSKLEILDLQSAAIVSSQGDGDDAKAAQIIKSITALTSNLRHLNLGKTTVVYPNKTTYAFAKHDFLDAKAAEALVYLQVHLLDYDTLYFYDFPLLETLIGPKKVAFATAYEDAFALPALKVLEGFEFNSDLIRARVKKRQQSVGSGNNEKSSAPVTVP